jgi:protein SCO1
MDGPYPKLLGAVAESFIMPLDGRFMKCLCLLSALLFAAPLWAAQRYQVNGLILSVDPAHLSFLASCKSVPGYMDAMEMPYSVRDSQLLRGLKPGSLVQFTLVVEGAASYVESLRISGFESLEVEPMQARGLKIIQNVMDPASNIALAVGQKVPDFTFHDQNAKAISLRQQSGKVVVATFIYTRCPNPSYCFRLSNNLGQLQKRFVSQMGRNLVLLSIIIDPQHDGPDTLQKYGRIWKADPEAWHFLDGPLPETQKVCRRFGMDFWQDDGFYVHSFHTVVVDREGKLAANLEGNQFTPQQLGDLVGSMLTTESAPPARH